jgi:hypothetical protein
MDGLRFVFQPVTLTRAPINSIRPGADSAAVVNAFTETEQSYARGARSLGLPEKLPETVVNSFGYTVLQGLKLPNVAVWVMQRNVAAYPDSPNVYDSLGDALLAKGDSTSAKAQFRRAKDVAVRLGQAPAAETIKKLEALENVTQAGAAKKK